MIRVVLFDLGGVVITIDHDEAVRRFKDLGLADAEERLNPYTQSGIFGQLEAGTIDGKQFQERLGQMIGRDVSYEECRYAWQGYAKEVPRRNLDRLLSLREQGFRVVLLSNTNPFMMDWAMSGDFDGEGHSMAFYFDELYLSYQMKMMKPNDLVYRHVMRMEKAFPYECLFVDDGPRNVAAASQIGIHTFCPLNGADWTKEIDNYLDLE
ncbi:MAG: HAD family phosphatase [Prevotella sp.]|nr:HAD family phosphatase [Prevotella sp.]